VLASRLSAASTYSPDSSLQILICTPGRLQDHLDNTPSVPQRLKGLKVLILDEADNLLNMGFRPAIEKILRYLPSQRQTLLFSATIPPQVHTVSKLALKPNNQFIDTVGEETEQTNIQVSVRSVHNGTYLFRT
jgi:ATP-dependent RNA helicase MSS116